MTEPYLKVTIASNKMIKNESGRSIGRLISSVSPDSPHILDHYKQDEEVVDHIKTEVTIHETIQNWLDSNGLPKCSKFVIHAGDHTIKGNGKFSIAKVIDPSDPPKFEDNKYYKHKNSNMYIQILNRVPLPNGGTLIAQFCHKTKKPVIEPIEDTVEERAKYKEITLTDYLLDGYPC